MSTTEREPLILLVTSGYHLYREYLLAQVSRAARVWLLQDQAPTWETPYIAGHTVVDTLDADAMIAAARALPGGERPDGVLGWDEVKMEQTARLARALGLPGPDPDAVTRCRDKHLTRAALAEHGVPSAKSTLVGSVDEAAAAAATTGYPVVLKPRALGASFGVVAAATPAELAEAYRMAREAEEDGVPFFERGVLVEEYLTGPEISVDCAVVDGRATPLFLARKVSGFAPYFEEVAHTVDAADPLLTDPELLDVLDRAHRAVGFTGGVTHVEVRLTPTGPRVVEINSRLGGGFIPYVARFAAGVDAGAAAVAVALGRAPRPPRGPARVAAVQFFYPDTDMTVRDAGVDPAALPPEVVAHGVLAQPGAQLLLPPASRVTCRYAYVITAGETAGACLESARAAEAAFTLVPEPVAVEV